MFLNLTKDNPLTPEILKVVPVGAIFATGLTIDGPNGCNLAGSGQPLTWVAEKGMIEDWAVYLAPETTNLDYVAMHGGKAHQPYNIRACIPCTDEALALYRR